MPQGSRLPGGADRATYASLLSDVTAILLQQAKSALERTGDLLKLALDSNPRRSPEEVENLSNALHSRLIGEAKTNAAAFGVHEVTAPGFPVTKLDPFDDQCRDIWRL